MEQVEGVSVIGFVFSCHAHHQHEVEEAMCSVAGIPEAFEAHFSQRAFDVSVGNPFYSFAVELRIGSMRTNWRGPPSSSERCPVPITATRSLLGHSSRRRRSVRPNSTYRQGCGSGGAKILV